MESDGGDMGYKDHPFEGQSFLWNLKNGRMPFATAFLRNIKSLFLGRKCNAQNVLTILLLFGLVLTFINISHLHNIIGDLEGKNFSPGAGSSSSEFIRKRKFALNGKRVDSGYLKHVLETFESVGWARVGVEEDWDVLWSHDYPFRTLKDRLSTISGEHKVNHFPGSGYITNKMNLATSSLPYVPKAFQLPKNKQMLLDYAKANPHKRFVQKSNNHRGIKIEKLEKLDLSSNNSFIQEYISNPLLIDGHKFDIGVYTTLTSISPLRVYIYNDVLFRFCPEQYHPFDQDAVDKYVVGDDYLPMWKVPSLSKFYNDLGFSMKESFDAWYKKTRKGQGSADNIWAQVEAAIRTIYLNKEDSILETTKKYTGGGVGRNFFEMVRFDFAIDDEGKVFIMEANMSPNLSSAHFPPNQLLYRQVLYNLFKLVGLATPHFSARSSKDSTQVSPKHLAVFAEECEGDKCAHDCDSVRCSLCGHCLSEETKETLRLAFLDHSNRGDCQRVFPPTNKYNESVLKGQDLDSFDNSKLNKENKLLLEWFRGKCQLDKSFC